MCMCMLMCMRMCCRPCVCACICRPTARGANHRTERERVGQRDGAAGSWSVQGLEVVLGLGKG